MIKRFYYVHNTNRISRPASEPGSGIREYGYQHVLLHVKRTRVKRKLPRSDPNLLCGQRPRHEPSDRERRHLYRDHRNDERLRAVSEEGVEEGEEDA